MLHGDNNGLILVEFIMLGPSYELDCPREGFGCSYYIVPIEKVRLCRGKVIVSLCLPTASLSTFALSNLPQHFKNFQLETKSLAISCRRARLIRADKVFSGRKLRHH